MTNSHLNTRMFYEVSHRFPSKAQAQATAVAEKLREALNLLLESRSVQDPSQNDSKAEDSDAQGQVGISVNLKR